MSPLLAAACTVMAMAALYELWGERGEEVRGRARRLLARAAGSRRLAGGPSLGGGRGRELIARAGLAGRLDPRAFQLARAGCAAAALPLAFALAPLAPGRAGALVTIGVPLGAGFLPELALLRLARIRTGRIVAALPDSLEIMAVGAASGRGSRTLLGAAEHACQGPLREELARTVSEIECGVAQRSALRGLAARGTPELAALAVLIERSRRLGSPLASGLQAQAASIREDGARRIGESASRAAPKIQLAVALLLVPSVLLLVAAAIVANAERLLGGL